MLGLMGSLLAVLEAKEREALALMEFGKTTHEPEGVFYIARHCGMLNATEPALQMLQRARLGGFWSSHALQHDMAFAGIREHPEFQDELKEAKRLEAQASQALLQALGYTFVQRQS